MNCFRLSRPMLVAAFTAWLLCSLPVAVAKKPGNPGGGGGGGGTSISYKIIRLDTGNDLLEGRATDVNDSRFVVGSINTFLDDEEYSKAACWSVTGALNSSLTMLGDSGFVEQSTSALGCNDLSEIVGSAGDVHATDWSDSDAPLTSLPSPFNLSEAQDINNNGVACGFASSAGEYVASVWYFVRGQWRHVSLPHMGDPLQNEEGEPLPDQSVAFAIGDMGASSLIAIAGQSNGNAVLWTVIADADGHLVTGLAFILSGDSVATRLNGFQHGDTRLLEPLLNVFPQTVVNLIDVAAANKKGPSRFRVV